MHEVEADHGHPQEVCEPCWKAGYDTADAAPAVTETDCCTMCGVPYDGSPLVLDHHAAGPHWHDPDGVTLHYRLSPDAAQREDRLATPAVTETDPIDAYLASPEAVGQLARAMRYHPDLRGKEGEYVEGWDAATRVALTVLRKVRAEGDDDGR